MLNMAQLFLVVALSLVAYGSSTNEGNFDIESDTGAPLYTADLRELMNTLGLDILNDSLAAAGLLDTLSGPGPFTLLAPTDNVFNSIPEWQEQEMLNQTSLEMIIKFHVLDTRVLSDEIENEMLVSTLLGTSLRFNVYMSLITAQCCPLDTLNTDKMAANGVLHELTRVMTPPYGTIVDSLTACPVFKILVRALHFTGLGDTLNGDGPFTLFAPTDEAFASLPPGKLGFLFKNKQAFTDVLMLHVITKTFCSASLSALTGIRTLNGKFLLIKSTAGNIKINNAKLLAEYADGSVTNGVVHAVDEVVSPLRAPSHFKELCDSHHV